MTKEQLIKKFPSIFKDYNKRKEGINSPFAWYGIECGNGWLPLINDLCTELDLMCPDQITAQQVKEKFGMLRFYIKYDGDGSWKFPQSIISKYENRSATICEYCGRHGSLNDNGWIKCLCDECRIKDKFEE
jgi:hypothetical protein